MSDAKRLFIRVRPLDGKTRRETERRQRRRGRDKGAVDALWLAVVSPILTPTPAKDGGD